MPKADRSETGRLVPRCRNPVQASTKPFLGCTTAHIAEDG